MGADEWGKTGEGEPAWEAGMGGVHHRINKSRKGILVE